MKNTTLLLTLVATIILGLGIISKAERTQPTAEIMRLPVDLAGLAR